MRILLALLTLGLGPAAAKPLFSSPQAVLERTRAIVTGTAGGDPQSGPMLTVHQVLWDPDGQFTGRTRIALGTPDHAVDVPGGESAVILFDARGAPAFAAQPATPVPVAELDRHPLRMRGFYAYNAHIVSPAVVSLAGLVKAMTARRFTERVRAEVGFGDERPPALVFEGTLSDGVVALTRAPLKVADARLGTWDHGLEISLKGARPLDLRGAFEALEGGVLVARLVPDRPFVGDVAAIDGWLATGRTRLPLVLRRGDAEAVLTLTGQTTGTLGPGLGIEGALAGFLRQTASGYRSQAGQGSAGASPGHGWHVEIATRRGILWLTLPVEVVDRGARPPLRPVISLQTALALAARAGPLPVRFSGALTGTGTLSMR